MLHNPEVMKKCQKEIDAVLSPNQLPKFKDRLNLRYVEAVICEVQRLCNVAPLGIAHRAMETAKFKSYIIPENTIVIPNLYSVHMDEKYWGDPFKFRPERFLDSTDNLILHENFMVFGFGKRRCVGENLAKSSLILFFSTFLRCFDISVPPGNKMPDLEAYDGITLSPKPYKVLLKPRSMN
jgi:methyl farnesoate epoxidase/farnesoate epoxidase